MDWWLKSLGASVYRVCSFLGSQGEALPETVGSVPVQVSGGLYISAHFYNCYVSQSSSCFLYGGRSTTHQRQQHASGTVRSSGVSISNREFIVCIRYNCTNTLIELLHWAYLTADPCYGSISSEAIVAIVGPVMALSPAYLALWGFMRRHYYRRCSAWSPLSTYVDKHFRAWATTSMSVQNRWSCSVLDSIVVSAPRFRFSANDSANDGSGVHPSTA